MNLKAMKIERVLWGDNEGKLEGKITFDTPNSEITIRLNSEHVRKIFAVCADALQEQAREASTGLLSNIIQALPAPEAAGEVGHE